MKSKPPERKKSALTYTWRVPMGLGVAVVFFMAAATGFYLVADRAWGVTLRVAAFGHPALGIAATGWLFVYTRWRSKCRDARRTFPAAGIIFSPAA